MIALLVLVFSALQSIASLEFYVSQHESSCLERNVTCCSIEHIAEKYGTNTSNLTLQFSEKININRLVVFENVSSLTFYSNSTSKPVLICSNNSGLKFIGVKALKIYNIKIVGCGFDGNLTKKTAIAILDCRNVLLENVIIDRSTTTSLLIDSVAVILRDIVVGQNNINLTTEGVAGKSATGGVQILVSRNNTSVEIEHCLFTGISVASKKLDPRKIDGIKNWLSFGLGGALLIVFDENIAHGIVSITSSRFEHSYAVFGAGAYIGYQDNCTNNSVVIRSSVFRECVAESGGGGLVLGITGKTSHNRFLIENSTFTKNHAKFGGGVYFFAFYSDSKLVKTNSLTFTHCNWTENTGNHSSAVDISPSRFHYYKSGNLPNPIFQNCNFVRNEITLVKNTYKSNLVTGIFVLTQVTVTFSGSFTFDSNAYSAVLLNSARIEFAPNTDVRFFNNSGFYGGAVALHGFSSLSFSNNCVIQFFNNTATEFGGAMYYHTTEQREFFSSRSCFLEYSGRKDTPVADRNITITFTGNFAQLCGSSIFASTFYSCYLSNRVALQGPNEIENFLQDIGNVTLDKFENNATHSLGTLTLYIQDSKKNKTLVTWPGKTCQLSLTAIDELGHVVRSKFVARVDKGSDSVLLEHPYTVDNSITLFGAPGDRASLTISTQNQYRIVQYVLEVELLHCPFGFYYDNSFQRCSCSAGDKSHKFPGIAKCTNNSATIERGLWAGYYNNETGVFYTGRCPLFCSLNRSTYEFSLPESSDSYELESVICGQTRFGVLCGRCRHGYSVYYHSNSFTCGKEDKCLFGFLLHIVSELLPVLLFFTVSICLEVNFLSGAMNGFIFYCQIVTVISCKYTTSQPNELVNILRVGHKLFYGIFNFDFFSVDELSFCLFRGATVMHILFFKYFTILFALVLILLLVKCFRCCTYCSKCFPFVKATKVSILHGLSTFLVISYAECVRISLFILRRDILRGPGDFDGPSVAYFGGMNYLENEHMFYAIFAISVLFLVGFLPCLVLLLYPSFLHLLQLCNLSEHRVVLAILRITRINSLKPLFDIFQGAFKDTHKFFAGLYLLYRIAILVPYSFSDDDMNYGVTYELLLLFFMLSAHSLLQPYKEKSHNVYDTLLFSNLMLIAGLGVVMKRQESLKIAITCIQLLLIYIPMMVFLSYFLLRIIRAAIKRCACRKRLTTVNDLSNDEFLEHLNDVMAEREPRKIGPFHSSYEQCM